MLFPALLNLGVLDGDDGFLLNGRSQQDQAGIAVDGLGDINGDGIDDIVIGAWEADVGPTDEPGIAHVVFGRAGGFGPSFALSALDGDNGFTFLGFSQNDDTGYTVSAAGDINDDGLQDILIGARVADNPPFGDAGVAYLVFGATDIPATIDATSLDGENGFRIPGPGQGAGMGRGIGRAGDVNGDGIDDLIVGAYKVDIPPTGSGRIDAAGTTYVIFGRTGPFDATFAVSTLDGANGFVVRGISEDHRSGEVVDGVGDINADGIDDVIIGSRSRDSFVLWGRTDGFSAVIDLSAVDPDDGFILRTAPDDTNGFSNAGVAGLGDVNGDGIDDLIVGTPSKNDSVGGAYVVFGRSEGFPAVFELSSLASDEGIVILGAGASTGDTNGRAGDLNGDGFGDFFLANSELEGRAGRTYVIFGRNGAFPATIDLSNLGTQGFLIAGATGGDQSGISAAAAGDIDGDGHDDLLIGANRRDPSGYDARGGAYIVYGRALPAATVTAISEDTGTAGDGVTTDRTLTVSGTATAGSSVHVFRDGIEIGTAPASGGGTWTFVDPATQAFGPHRYAARPEDALGNLGPRSPDFDVFVVDPARLPTAGNDAVIGSAAANVIQGGEGNDTVFGEAGNDTLRGNNGNDWLFGGADADRLEAGNGADMARGGNGNDTVYGENGNDRLYGDNGNDRIEAGSGLDLVDGGAGNDTVYGGGDTDTLFGGLGSDQLFGDAAGDLLLPGADAVRDSIIGTAAHLTDDTIDGFIADSLAGAGIAGDADMVFVSGMTNAQRAQIDGDLLDAQGRLFLPGGGAITFLGHAGAEVDAVFVSGGVQIWLI